MNPLTKGFYSRVPRNSVTSGSGTARRNCHPHFSIVYIWLSPPPTGSDPEYEQKIQFAVKLGYTEEQLQLALVKLGPQHTQNDLLAELIKLGSLAKAESEYEANTGRQAVQLELSVLLLRHCILHSGPK